MKSPDPTTPPGQEPARKPYSRPVLRAYGTIRAITRNVANKSAVADGGGMFSKTA